MPITTPNYGWTTPAGTDKPEVPKWLDLLGKAIDATVYGIDSRLHAAHALASTATTVANAAMPKAGGTFTGAVSGVAGTAAAHLVTKAQLDAKQDAISTYAVGFKAYGTTTASGIMHVPYPANTVAAVPDVIVVTGGNQAAAGTTNVWIADGTTPGIPAPTLDGFSAGGFQPNTAILIYVVMYGRMKAHPKTVEVQARPYPEAGEATT